MTIGDFLNAHYDDLYTIVVWFTLFAGFRTLFRK